MKKRKNIFWAVLVVIFFVVAITAIYIGVQVGPTVNHALRISQLLQPMIEAENRSAHISVSAKVNDRSIGLDSDVYMLTEENVPYFALEQNGTTVYITDNILLLENGKAFKLGEKLQTQVVSYADLLPQVGELFDALKITAQKTDTETIYSVAVTGEQVSNLLAAVSVAEALPVDGIQKLNLSLTEQDGNLAQIQLSGSGKLDGTAFELDITISDFRVLASGSFPIPNAVKETAATVDPDSLFSLTRDLYRLVLALAPLADMESVSGTLALRVDCGLIQLDTEMKLSDWQTSPAGQTDPEQLKKLPEMVGLLCMEGQISCVQRDDTYVYTLELDKDAMGQLSRMILPELTQYGGDLEEGSVTVLLEGGAVSSMEISIEGAVGGWLVSIPITVGATFSFD